MPRAEPNDGPRPANCRSGRRSPNRHNPEWSPDAIMFGDRDIFARDELMTVKMESRLVIIAPRLVGKHPAIMAQVQQGPTAHFLTGPKAMHPTFILQFLEALEMQMPISIKGRHEFIAAFRAAIGITRGPRQFEPNGAQGDGICLL